MSPQFPSVIPKYHQNSLIAKKAKRKLGLFIPLTLIQVQHMNAKVISMTGEP